MCIRLVHYAQGLEKIPGDPPNDMGSRYKFMKRYTEKIYFRYARVLTNLVFHFASLMPVPGYPPANYIPDLGTSILVYWQAYYALAPDYEWHVHCALYVIDSSQQTNMNILCMLFVKGNLHRTKTYLIHRALSVDCQRPNYLQNSSFEYKLVHFCGFLFCSSCPFVSVCGTWCMVLVLIYLKISDFFPLFWKCTVIPQIVSTEIILIFCQIEAQNANQKVLINNHLTSIHTLALHCIVLEGQ